MYTGRIRTMRAEMDTIQFESRAEIKVIMGVINTYVEQNPEEKQNEILEAFFNCLDVMDMTW